LLGFIDDLEISLSAKKMQQSGRNDEQGHINQHYHKFLLTVLQQLINIQQQGGTPLYIRMGDNIIYLNLNPMVSIVTGDAKSCNTLCCTYLGKDYLGRVPCITQ
jgi:hypothetical protein